MVEELREALKLDEETADWANRQAEGHAMDLEEAAAILNRWDASSDSLAELWTAIKYATQAATNIADLAEGIARSLKQ